MTDSARGVLLRFAPMIYGPTALFAIGQGAVVPLIPIVAATLGADLALSGLVASMLVVGQLCGNLPAGYLVSRFGERITMIVAGSIALLGAVGIALAPSLAVLTVAVFTIGMCAATFGLARHAFMATRVPLSFRARALALLGGTFRFGFFVGPFLGALLLGITGTEASAAWAFATCLVACVALVAFGPDPETRLQAEAQTRTAQLPPRGLSDTGEAVTGGIAVPNGGRSAGVFRTMIDNRVVLMRLGLAAASMSAVRSARFVVLPLWGVSLALDAQTISLVVGISGAIDFALFYASGQVMDRFGRLWASVPAMLMMGAGFIALALTHDLPDAAMWFAMFAAVIGVGNGLSSGILLTLGADVAPKNNPAAFLGSWRMLSDLGGATSQVMIAGIAAIATLSVATGAMGAIGLLGALGFLRWVPRFVQKPPRNDAT